MTNGWQTVPLGEFLTQRKEFFTIDDLMRYKRARIQLHGKGIVLRDEVDGEEIKTKEQQAARIGELLVAEIDAKVGGFGIVPPELDGAIVSSHYFLFEINEQKCLHEWLDWCIRSGILEEQVRAHGSTNYSSIRPSHVLKYKIPLPPLTEQRRIVGCIEALAGRLAEAQSLREEASEEAEVLTMSIWKQLFDELGERFGCKRLGEPNIAIIIAGQHILAKDYNQSGDGFPYLTGPADFGERVPIVTKWTNKKKSIAQPGDVLITVKGAGVGKTNFAPSIDVSIGRQIMAIRAEHDVLFPSFLYYFLNHKFRHIQSLATATTVPGIKKTDVEDILIPLPPLEEQRRLVAYLDGLQAQVSQLRTRQEETQKELDALMPSILDKAFKGGL
ncbi:MAG: restriction endonuclease subunit S [Anaerolineales bacterium]